MHESAELVPFENQITLTGQLSINDARQGVRLTSMTFFGNVFRAVWILCLFGCLWGLWQYVFRTDADDLTLSDGILTAICFALPSLLMFQYALTREHWRRLWEKKLYYFRPMEAVLHAVGISLNAENYRAECAWEYFTEYRRTDRVVVLFSSGGSMFFGRSRFAKDADWDRFVKFVEARFQQRN